MAHFHYSNQEPIKQNKKDTEETEMDSIIFATDSFLPNLSWVMGGQAGISSNSSLLFLHFVKISLQCPSALSLDAHTLTAFSLLFNLRSHI